MQPRAPTCTSANCFCPPNTAYIDPNVTKGIQFICNSVDAAPTAGGDPSNHQGFNTTTGYFTCFDGYVTIDIPATSPTSLLLESSSQSLTSPQIHCH